MNLDPYYLIGAVSENAGYSFVAAKKLLTENKCGKAVKEFELEQKRKAKAAQALEEEKAASGVAESPAETAADTVKELSPQAAIQKLSEDDIMILFQGLIIKAGTGKPQAVADITKITEILLG